MTQPTSSSSLATRKVSLHERFSVTCRNLGVPPILVFVVTYSSSSLVPSRSFLSDRIAQLQEHFPLLQSLIKDARSRKPYYQQRERPWNAEEVLRHGGVYKSEDPAGMILEEIIRMTAVDIEMHPLWQVTTTDHHLVLSVDHVLVDGRGVANLLSALLSPSIDDLPHEAFSTVPLFEESIDIRPSYAHFVPIVWKKIILPRLPAFVQRYFKVPEPWPDTNFSLTPKECRSDNSLLSIPSDVVERVKTAGKGKSVPTLHPIIEFAFLVAIWSVFGRTHPSFFLSSSTPRSERDTNLGHSYCTVNYTSSSEYTLPLSPSDGFWTLAQTMSTYLRSDVGRKKALWGVGMLAFVPDPPKAVPTGWETFLSEQAERPHPFRASLSISNLGYVALPNGASDLAWSQTCASIFAPGFSVSLLGHVGGLRVVSSWREGAAVTRNEAMRVETAFGEVLQRLGDTTWEATTLSELVA